MPSRYRASIRHWNRLEGRPRTEDFDRALKAEVRDGLWMLSKQWQMGEFKGDDAGSPILAKAHLQATRLTKYQAGETTQSFDRDVPLEVKVEQQRLPFQIGDQYVSLDLRLLMGRQWLKMLKTLDPPDPTLAAKFLVAYSIDPPNPTDPSDVPITAHVNAWQEVAAVAGRRMDGYELYADLIAGNAASNRIDAGASTGAVDGLGEPFMAWFRRLYYQPDATTPNPSWRPEYLEHQFSCSAPADENGDEKVLFADEYYHGHLDWYNLDIDQERAQLPSVGDALAWADVEQRFTLSFIPAPMTFAGMPHTRWWTFEDWKTNLGGIEPDTTDINKLLLIEFGLVYANDWYLLPFTLPVGSLASVKGLLVTNVFGENTWVDAAGKGNDQDWERWNMYSLAIRGDEDVEADLSLVLLPAVPKTLEGKPLEESFLLRDEVANMVWGVETLVPLVTGKNKPGREAGLELFAKFQQLVPPATPPALIANDAAVRYQLVNSVPENWIPFIPARKEDDPNHRQIQIQRAAMPRILEGDTAVPKKIEPRTSLLREGLDAETPHSYFIHEEEVPRGGVLVRKSFQRTRWLNGKVFTWVGMHKQTGRGQGHSGLAFDQLQPIEKADR